jgi:hypothetical protein
MVGAGADRLSAPALARRCPRRIRAERRRTQTRSHPLAQTGVRPVGNRMRFPSLPPHTRLGLPDSPPLHPPPRPRAHVTLRSGMGNVRGRGASGASVRGSLTYCYPWAHAALDGGRDLTEELRGLDCLGLGEVSTVSATAGARDCNTQCRAEPRLASGLPRRSVSRGKGSSARSVERQTRCNAQPDVPRHRYI